MKFCNHRWSLPVFLTLCASLFAGDEPPEWVRNKHAAHFAEASYIQAVGQAAKEKTPDEDFARAAEQARKAIAEQLQVSIKSQSVMFTFESSAGEFQQQSSEKILTATNITLSGLKIADRYFDKKLKIYYALAVLDRSVAAKAMRHEIEALKDNAANALQTAKAALDSNEALQAVFNSHRAYQLLQAAESRQQLLGVLQAAKADEIPTLPNSEEILKIADDAVRSVRIETNAPSKVIHRQNHLPLVIEAVVKGGKRPLGNISLSCSFRKGRGNANVRARTDGYGHTTIVVTALGPAPYGEYVLEVRPDFSELLFKDEHSAAQAWNLALQQALRAEIISFKRLDPDLADYCAGTAIDLAKQLKSDDGSFQLALGNITYAETGAASAFVAYFKELMASELSLQPTLKLIAPDKIESSIRNVRANYLGHKRPDQPEILAELIDANGILAGTYWERGDILEFNLQIIQRNTAAILAATTMKLPKSLIPAALPYLPTNYFTTFSEARQLNDVKTPKADLKVDVWSDRGDGAIYKAGERVTIFIRATQDCYLYLIYHDAGGNDVLIYPNARQANNRILGEVIYQIPDGRDSFDFTVQKPFGNELLKAVVSIEPLPDLSGVILPNGLKLLSGSYKDNMTRIRGVTMQARVPGYAEGSCVITTTE